MSESRPTCDDTVVPKHQSRRSRRHQSWWSFCDEDDVSKYGVGQEAGWWSASMRIKERTAGVRGKTLEELWLDEASF
jgi:hypothetical protein